MGFRSVVAVLSLPARAACSLFTPQVKYTARLGGPRFYSTDASKNQKWKLKGREHDAQRARGTPHVTAAAPAAATLSQKQQRLQRGVADKPLINDGATVAIGVSDLQRAVQAGILTMDQCAKLWDTFCQTGDSVLTDDTDYDAHESYTHRSTPAAYSTPAAAKKQPQHQQQDVTLLVAEQKHRKMERAEKAARKEAKMVEEAVRRAERVAGKAAVAQTIRDVAAFAKQGLAAAQRRRKKEKKKEAKRKKRAAEQAAIDRVVANTTWRYPTNGNTKKQEAVRRAEKEERKAARSKAKKASKSLRDEDMATLKRRGPKKVAGGAKKNHRAAVESPSPLPSPFGDVTCTYGLCRTGWLNSLRARVIAEAHVARSRSAMSVAFTSSKEAKAAKLEHKRVVAAAAPKRRRRSKRKGGSTLVGLESSLAFALTLENTESIAKG